MSQSNLMDTSAILKLKDTDPAKAQELWQSLSQQEQTEMLLATPDAKQKLELILLAKNSQALTRALKPDNFVRLVLDIGPEDSVELISMSSNEQLTHLLDLTGWDQEEFSPARYEAWLPLLLEAGPDKLAEWLESTDMEVLTLLGHHWFTLVKFITSQEQQEPPDDLPEFTLDGVYFLEFNNPNLAAIVAQVLVVLKSELPGRYADLMEAMRWEVGSEMSEYARRWRQGRLLDQGFPLRDEALSLWAKPRPDEYNWQDKPPKYQSMDHTGAQPDYWQELLPPDQLLPAAMSGLSRQDLDSLNQEITYIANSGIVALNADPADNRLAMQAGREALSMVNLGLSLLAGEDQAQARAIVTRLSLAALARHGALAIRQLHLKAFKLVHEGWMKDLPTGLNVLDFPLDHWLAGLLFKLPRYYDQGQRPEYRGFYNIQELRQAEAQLDETAFWGKLMFDLLGWSRVEVLAILTAPGWPMDPLERKLSHLLGTWLARRSLGLPGLEPLPRAQLSEAVKTLQAGLKSGEWASLALASGQGLDNQHDAQLARTTLAHALEHLNAQVVNLKVMDDPEFIRGLIVTL